jgi:hypothetical protein
VKLLLDECVDRRLARDLVGHSVSTVPRRGWAGIKNGELLTSAEQEFDVFITVDRKLSTQQDPDEVQDTGAAASLANQPLGRHSSAGS